MGSIRLKQGISRTIQFARAHPAYLADDRQAYDFALIKLSTSALVDEDGQPTGMQVIELNRNASVPQPGDVLQAMGFGKVRDEESLGMNGRMQQVQVEYMDNEICQDQYGFYQFWDHIMFCSGVEGGGKDTCQGDSGAPLVDIATGTLTGVVSFGKQRIANGLVGRFWMYPSLRSPFPSIRKAMGVHAGMLLESMRESHPSLIGSRQKYAKVLISLLITAWNLKTMHQQTRQKWQ